jgi:hypothetical protein
MARAGSNTERDAEVGKGIWGGVTKDSSRRWERLGEVGGIDMVLKVLTRVRLITVVVGLTFGFVIVGCGGDEDPAEGAFDRVPGSVEAGVSDAADYMGEQYDEAATEPVELGGSSGRVIEDAEDESEKSARVAGDAATGSGDSATSDAPEVWTD